MCQFEWQRAHSEKGSIAKSQIQLIRKREERYIRGDLVSKHIDDEYLFYTDGKASFQTPKYR